MREETRRLAFELGLTDDYIRERAAETRELAKEKGIDFSGPVLIGYDAQGPQVRVIDANFTPLVNIQKAILAVYLSPKVYKAIISGWDLSTLRFFRDKRLGIKDMGLIGELGSVFEDGGKIYRIHPIPEEIHCLLKQKIFIEAAKTGLKIAIQGNNSNRVVDIYFEGDEPGRGDTRNHFLVKGTDIQTRDLYELIRNKTGFEFDGEGIRFEPSYENIKEIDWVLGHVKPLNSVRLSWENERILLRRDSMDDRSFNLDDMREFAERVAPSGWDVDPNPDFCVDFIYRGDGISTSKEDAANILARRKFKTGKYAITNVGDKKGDVLRGENTISFTLIGTSADEYCRQCGIPHVSVTNAVDYSLILAEILNDDSISSESLAELLIEDLFPRVRSKRGL